MRRTDLEHVIRAAAAVAGEDEIVVIGSQAILGRLPDAPDALLWSQEADVYPPAHPERAEPHDVVLAKCAAGRERDWEFAREAIRAGVVDAEELLRRAGDLPLPAAQRRRIARLLRGLAEDAAG